MIFTQKFSSVGYLFVYIAGENNVVGLIYPTTDITDTMEAYMTDYDMVDTMGYNMLEAMELKNDNICDDYDYSCGR